MAFPARLSLAGCAPAPADEVRVETELEPHEAAVRFESEVPKSGRRSRGEVERSFIFRRTRKQRGSTPAGTRATLSSCQKWFAHMATASSLMSRLLVNKRPTGARLGERE